MPTGKSIRIYLADGSVSGIRHGEIVNWTGQAVACPRSRASELSEWPEIKRPGIYFLFGHDDENGRDAAYIGEAEVVIDRLVQHLSGKDFWSEAIVFTSKDDNLTKGHVRYLESRLVEMASKAGRYDVKNGNSPQLPALPRADRDAMEEYLDGVRILLGVLGHKVIEPLIAGPLSGRISSSADTNSPDPNPNPIIDFGPVEFRLKVSGLNARATRTDEGLVVFAGSEAALSAQQSLSPGYRALRDKLITSGALIAGINGLTFSREHLFTSPSQAAAVIVGYPMNGPASWKLPDGTTYAQYEEGEAKMAKTNSTSSSDG